MFLERLKNIFSVFASYIHCTLREFKTSGLSCTRDTCWSIQLPDVLAKSSMLLLETVLKLKY